MKYKEKVGCEGGHGFCLFCIKHYNYNNEILNLLKQYQQTQYFEGFIVHAITAIDINKLKKSRKKKV